MNNINKIILITFLTFGQLQLFKTSLIQINKICLKETELSSKIFLLNGLIMFFSGLTYIYTIKKYLV